MRGFSSTLVSTDSEDGHHFILTKELAYVSDAGETIVVPVGAQTDGASTPHALWPTLPPFGKYWRAAILHDWLYRGTQRPRPECDALLLEAMNSIGVDTITGHIIYDGVRAGGEAAFEADRQGGIK